jgi:hypothetical protein
MPASASVIDALNGLLEAEVNSIFRFVEEGSPYLSQATAEVRRPLAEMNELSRRHHRELVNLIDSLGGVPLGPRGLRADEQYLSFLSLKFLLPKLVAEKELILQRYENARHAIGKKYPDVRKVLDRMIAEQRPYFEMLRKAAHDITGGKFEG